MEHGASQSLDKFSEAAGTFLKVYVLVTILCIILDIIQFFSGVGKYGAVDKTVYCGVASIVIAFIFLAMDFYFILWAVSVRMKLPEYARGYVFYALLGFVSSMTAALDAKVGKVRTNAKD